MAFKRPESVLVVLYQGTDVLLLQRKDDPAFWQSVTGTVEHGEAPLQTAYREVEEETGILLNASSKQIVDAQVTNRFTIRKEWQHRYAPGETENTEFVFYAKVPRDAPIVLTEHLQFEWVTKAEALARVWSPSNQQAIERFVPNP